METKPRRALLGSRRPAKSLRHEEWQQLIADLGPSGAFGSSLGGSHAPMSGPELALAAEVFLSAIDDYRHERRVPPRVPPRIGRPPLTVQPRREANESLAAFEARVRRQVERRVSPNPYVLPSAHQWLMDDDATWPFSFVNLCLLFGLDAEEVRRALTRSMPRLHSVGGTG